MRGIVSKQESPYIPNLVNNLTSPSSLSSGIIRGFLQSENYMQGSSGWKIDRSGVIQALQINIAGASTVAGWSIDGNRIFKTNAVLHSDGYVAFGSTPPTGYGNNVGAWLGTDGGSAKMSLYKDSNNYLQWDGDKVLIKAENFSIDSSGNLTSAAGTIGGWTISENKFSSGNLDIDSNTPRILMKKNGQNKLVIEG